MATQVQNSIPYMLLFEDDVRLVPQQMHASCVAARQHEMIVLHWWGEGYRTSLKGAAGVLRCLCTQGIRANVDDQIRGCDEFVGAGVKQKFRLLDNGSVLVRQNKGNIRKTASIHAHADYLRRITRMPSSACAEWELGGWKIAEHPHPFRNTTSVAPALQREESGVAAGLAPGLTT